MQRVVVTGMGIVSSIGNNKAEVLNSLKESKSGIKKSSSFKEMGLASQVAGDIEIDTQEEIDRRILRFMGPGAAYAYIALKEAIQDASLPDSLVSSEMTGLVAGSGGPSTKSIVSSADILRKSGVRRVGPFQVTQAMCSTISATLATPFKIKGHNYSMASACATSAHCIGHGAELIQYGKQNIVFAGGGEEVDWTLAVLFDAMRALSKNYNETPHLASRAFDQNRDGFIISGGAGMLVLEEYEHAKKRDAHIYAELVGYGATSDGYDMVQPSGEGALRCMHQALKTTKKPIDYVNAHGTSTPLGDKTELASLKKLFANKSTQITSTKSLTGHALGAAGVNEAIYSLLMMENNFIAPAANIEVLDEAADGLKIPLTAIENCDIQSALSNSFGFGGTNASLAFSKL